MGTDVTLRRTAAHLRVWLAEHRAAAMVVSGLAVATWVLWGALVVTDGPVMRASAAGDADDPGVAAGGSPTPLASDAAPEPDTPEPPGPESEEPEPEEPEPEEPEPLDPEDHAPLDPSDPDERWIVVVASYGSPTSAEREVRERTDEQGAEPRLLWSSSYASLTPDLWVVFEGPYPDRDAARAAADELGGDAYVRDLAGDADG